MTSLKLELVKHNVPKQEKQNKHLEGEKFAHDIIIENIRFPGPWFFGDEQKQKEHEQLILNSLRKAKVETKKG